MAQIRIPSSSSSDNRMSSIALPLLLISLLVILLGVLITLNYEQLSFNIMTIWNQIQTK